ncbi:MAG: hypothetical protein IPN70_05260 [Candidatus Moraniibacteriota bacterium]|nr:MAG: hypothetical protein IPN70_05260 [Candidatus Moranbacteria bacterium]
MKSHYKNILSRPAEAIIHFSDVFSGNEQDFDAELTVILRNIGTLTDKTYFVGARASLAGYGAVLLNDLFRERFQILSFIKEEKRVSESTLFSILNSLPREGHDREKFPNGMDFHLAITAGGVCFFATPLETLSALETRNEIVALYRIPNEHIPFTDGTKEQFRSSIIASSRFCPEVMETIYEYATIEDILSAKQAGLHPQIIPEQSSEIEFAYADRFGNVRLSVRDGKALRNRLKTSASKEVRVIINDTEPINALYVRSLADVPVGQIGLYENVADASFPHRKACYWELVKKSDHCLLDDEMAFDLIKKRSSNVGKTTFQILCA